MNLTSNGIPAEVRERVVAAATELFERSGWQTMPTVDAVRRAARVDMNAASSVMKEWRRAQIAQAAPVVVDVPEAVQQASSAAVATIWQQAQELANEPLRRAQAAWETERAELDAMRQELAEAFERQAGELNAAEIALGAEKVTTAQQAQELVALIEQLAGELSRADKAEARIAEIERRAADLRGELDRAHADAGSLRIENAQARKQVSAEIDAARAATDAARGELVKIQHERDTAAKAAAEAREHASGLAGQLHAMQQQNAALLATIKPISESISKKTPTDKN